MVTNMWAYESVFYQIYPMGFCGVPFENDGIQRHEIKRVEEWIPHMQKLGVNAVYFSPVFESDTHGYNMGFTEAEVVKLFANTSDHSWLLQKSLSYYPRFQYC